MFLVPPEIVSPVVFCRSPETRVEIVPIDLSVLNCSVIYLIDYTTKVLHQNLCLCANKLFFLFTFRQAALISGMKSNDSFDNFGKVYDQQIIDSEEEESRTSFLVLNEVVVNRGTSQYLCNLDLYLEGRQITSVQGDGLIISTPTGSTAYAVAAGASMVHPDVPSILIAPICPHSLSFRPIIVPAGVELKFSVSKSARGSAWVSFDGSSTKEIKQGDMVSIRTSIHPTPCVCRNNPFDDWFDSLSTCLHWNSRESQKALGSGDV